LPTATFYTLGCKVNQYETEKIREKMEAYGFQTVAFPGPADVLVVNTCTVTSTADGKSRGAIRRAARISPGAIVVVTGCGAELDPVSFSRIEGVDLVVGNARKLEIAERIAARFAGLCGNGNRPVRPRSRTRAIVKVQDGCDQFCSYCTIPLARSQRMSRRLGEVVDEIRTLADFGYKEIVLTGIRLGSYSDEDSMGLSELVLAAAEVDGIERVRLSSVEVWEISAPLVQALRHPKVCRHLHVPLQSGDDGILKAMRRPYTAAQYAETVEAVRSAVPGLALTTDVMVGFPGESEEAFRRTREFVERIRFSRLHVFRYSARPNTRAATLAGQVRAEVSQRRSRELIAVGERLSEDFARRLVGKTVNVLVETRRREAGVLCGLTDNYVQVEFEGPEGLRGQIVPVRITACRGATLIGETADVA